MTSKVDHILENAKAENRAVLYEHEAKIICMEYGVDTPRFQLADSPGEAVEAAERLGYPVVLKVVSPHVTHKSDVGGVLVNLKNPEEVKTGFEVVAANLRRYASKAEFKGVLVQKMAPPGLELIIGSLADPQFGPTVMLGMGGLYVELYRDVSFRIAPINKEDAEEMIEELKASKILKGYRRQPRLDIGAIVDALVKVSNLTARYEGVIEQLDLNPVLVYEKGLQAVDARIILKSSTSTSRWNELFSTVHLKALNRKNTSQIRYQHTIIKY
ncbi:MAG: acetate--CoA ligase family protein [Candidatus Bathyarchaeia archaeon]